VIEVTLLSKPSVFNIISFVVLLIIVIIFVIRLLRTSCSITENALTALLSVILFFSILTVPGIYSNITDTTVNKILSKELIPWAMIQDQVNRDTIALTESSGASDPYLDYLREVDGLGDTEYGMQDPGIRIKWMSPKKENIFDMLYNKYDFLADSGSFQLLRGLFSSTVGGVEYTPDKKAIYVYRPYTFITREARDSFKSLSNHGISNNTSLVRSDAHHYNPTTPDYKFKYWGSALDERMEELYAKEVINDISVVKPQVSEDDYRCWHLGNEGLTKAIFDTNLSPTEGGFSYTDFNDPSISYFAKLTESPFYYFYNALNTKYGDDFKNALMKEGTFYVLPNEVQNIKIIEFTEITSLEIKIGTVITS
jgi:hypothetical protein